MGTGAAGTGLRGCATTAGSAGDTGTAARTAVLLGLLVALGLSLRGAIPGVRPGPQEPPVDGEASLAGVVVLLAASVLIMAVALAAAFRKPVPAAPSGGRELPLEGHGPKARLRRRLMLIAGGLASACLLALVLATFLNTTPAELGRQEPPSPSVAADDGAPATVPPSAPRRPERPDDRVLLYLEVTTVALVAMTLVGTVVTTVRGRRMRREPTLGPLLVAAAGPASEPEPLVVAAQRGLAEVADLRRGPREAIIACYAAMERALADSPEVAPRDSDTPSEVLARAVANGVLGVDSASALVELFAEARFSRHVMTEDHREQAERLLRAVLHELGRPTATNRGAS
ncbi:MAG: DUF4129 domain-containing protein [Mycobacterium sp.]|nr:DUF4129 domain-containing protein [Mycobacterium sp.]